METSDQQLLTQIAAGDGTAFAAFYERHSARVYGLLNRWLRHRGGDADDVLQETFWQVWRRAGQYDASRSPPTAWLVLIARSRALDHLRRRKVVARPPETNDLVLESDPAHALERDEASAQVHLALDQLPDEQRRAI